MKVVLWWWIHSLLSFCGRLRGTSLRVWWSPHRGRRGHPELPLWEGKMVSPFWKAVAVSSEAKLKLTMQVSNSTLCTQKKLKYMFVQRHTQMATETLFTAAKKQLRCLLAADGKEKKILSLWRNTAHHYKEKTTQCRWASQTSHLRPSRASFSIEIGLTL